MLKLKTPVEIATKFKLTFGDDPAAPPGTRSPESGDAETIRDIDALQVLGLDDGRKGTYAEDDFTTQNLDWYWARGAEAERLEEQIGAREGAVLAIYRTAFRLGRAEAKLASRAAAA